MPRRAVNGYLDLGPTRIPPPPAGIVFTDRADGTLWALVHDATLTWVGLDTDLPADEAVVYGAFSEPYLADLRLFVENGILGYEDTPDRALSRSGALITRVGLTPQFKLVLPVDWSLGDTLAYDDELET